MVIGEVMERHNTQWEVSYPNTLGARGVLGLVKCSDNRTPRKYYYGLLIWGCGQEIIMMYTCWGREWRPVNGENFDCLERCAVIVTAV